MRFNKYWLANYDNKVAFLNFQKTVPFCLLSDISSENDSISVTNALKLIKFPVETLICLGEKDLNIGFKLSPSALLDKQYSHFFNSCHIIFCPAENHLPNTHILSCVLGGAIPIVKNSYPNLNKLGLGRYASDYTTDDLALLLSDILKHPIHYNYHIKQLSRRYERARKKFEAKQL
jgi:hypothetical protein